MNWIHASMLNTPCFYNSESGEVLFTSKLSFWWVGVILRVDAFLWDLFDITFLGDLSEGFNVTLYNGKPITGFDLFKIAEVLIEED